MSDGGERVQLSDREGAAAGEDRGSGEGVEFRCGVNAVVDGGIVQRQGGDGPGEVAEINPGLRIHTDLQRSAGGPVAKDLKFAAARDGDVGVAHRTGIGEDGAALGMNFPGAGERVATVGEGDGAGVGGGGEAFGDADEAAAEDL